MDVACDLLFAIRRRFICIRVFSPSETLGIPAITGKSTERHSDNNFLDTDEKKLK